MTNCFECRYEIDPMFLVEDEGMPYHRACLEIDNTEKVICQICQEGYKIISKGHVEKHDLNMYEYRVKYGRVTSKEYNQVLSRSSRMKKTVSSIEWKTFGQWEANGNGSNLQEYKDDLKRKLEEIIPQNVLNQDVLDFIETHQERREAGLFINRETLGLLQVVALRELVNKLVDRTITAKSTGIDKELCLQKLERIIR